MRVLVAAFCVALTTVAYSGVAPKASCNLAGVDSISLEQSESQNFLPFWKKKRKKMKTSGRMKKSNKKMAKKFKRQNDDRLRRD